VPEQAQRMNAARQPPEPVTPPGKRGVTGRARTTVVGGFGALALLAGGVTNWDTIEKALFPNKPVGVAHIVALVESDITRQEYDAELLQHTGPTAATVGRPSPQDSFAVYVVPAGTQPGAGRFLAVGSGGEPTATTQGTPNSTEQKAKQEAGKLAEEAKQAEESAAHEKERATEEKKNAEMHVREEQNKEQEEEAKEQAAQKRAEETHEHGPTQAKAEQETAKKKAEEAHEAVQEKKQEVQVKQREAVRPPVERRIERGSSAGQVEAVLDEAGVPEKCRPMCALEPIVERALKHTSGDASAAAREVGSLATRDVGAAIRFSITLKGLQGKDVRLSYALVQDSGPVPPAEYLGQVPLKPYVPTSEDEPEATTCWVALPTSSQKYHLALTVVDGDKPVTFLDTSSFD
jgi:hypothetical protein